MMNQQKSMMNQQNEASKGTESRTPWHSMTYEEVMEKIETSRDGLSEKEANNRQKRFGFNRLPDPPKQNPIKRFLMQFHNVLIYVLLGAGVVTALLADWVDAFVILGVIIINALIGFFQEGKAEKAIDAIRGTLSNKAMAMRDGHRLTVNAEQLVPGDVVFLQSGDKVPADIRLFQSKDLRIEEASLTGESVPVEKITDPASPDATLGDRQCMTFSGTLVASGQGQGVVVTIGEKTELGKVSSLLLDVQPLTTRLTKQMDEVSRWLTVAILILAIGTLIFGLAIRNYSFSEIFFASVALAVAAIPEGLPAIITITLALGVQRMARRQAIIRRLPAVETLGSVTVICSDKTGTLTRNEMTVSTVVTTEGSYQVEGVGYDPHGGFISSGNEVNPTDNTLLFELIRAALLCNDGALVQQEGQWQAQGDPTDGALIALAMKAGLEQDVSHKQYPRLDTIPFESEHKFMATLHHDHAGENFIYVKGAPERILEMSRQQKAGKNLETIDTKLWTKQIEAIAKKGQRTLAVATLAFGDRQTMRFDDVQSGLVMLGLFGLIDPPRKEAVEAIQHCRNAGIRVKMITGDHALTASAIGAQIGFHDTGDAVTGQQLETMDNKQLQLLVQQVDIFARVSPEHKLRLVNALQANDQVVAMTGDGINDAPALKRADVGVAMGVKGTEAAKEAAEMVLADDNFRTITHAVEEGRTVYDNIKKTLVFILPTNGAQAGIIIASVMMGIALPITPIQILWVNMVTAVTLGLSLAFEPPEDDVMNRPPRSPKEPLLSQFLAWRIIFVSSIMVMGTLGLFLWDRFHGETLEMARTTAVNTLIFFQIFYLLNTRSFNTSVITAKKLTQNPASLWAIGGIILLQILFTYLPAFQNIFGTATIPIGDWVRILVFTIFVFVLVEFEKVFIRSYTRRKNEQVV